MTNKIKRALAAIVAVVLIITPVFGQIIIDAFADQTICYETVDEIGVSDNTVTTGYETTEDELAAEGDDDTVYPFGMHCVGLNNFYEGRESYAPPLDTHMYHMVEDVDYTAVKLPDAGTWRYDQTFARNDVFNALNQVRMNPDYWWYDVNWATGEKAGTTERIRVTMTKPYVYDYELERCAMQRCIELSELGGHKRPDGEDCDEVFYDLDSMYRYIQTSEMNATNYWYAGLTSSSDNYSRVTGLEVAETFMEHNGSSAMAHRECILTDDYYRIGIACIRTKGIRQADGTYNERLLTEIFVAEDHYDWSREEVLAHGFTYVNENDSTAPLMDDASQYPCIDTYKEVTIKDASPEKNNCILFENNNKASDNSGKVELKIGETYDLRDKWFGIGYNGIAFFRGDDPKLSWYSTNTNVLKVENGIVTAVGSGDAEIKSDGAPPAQGGRFAPIAEFRVLAPETEPVVTEPTIVPSSNPEITNHNTVYDTGGSDGSVEEVTERAKENQIISLKKTSYTYKYKKLKKKSVKFRIKPVVNNGMNHGAVSYKVTKYPKGGKKYIKVNKSGYVTLKKKAKKGTYKVKISVAETPFMKPATKTITIKVK